MGDIHYISGSTKKKDGNGEPPMTGIEQRVTRIEAQMEHVARREDIQTLRADINEKFSEINKSFGDARASLIMWSVSAIIATGGLVLGIAKYL